MRCVVDSAVALERTLRRGRENPVRRAYADRRPEGVALGHTGFDWVCMDAPWIKVDTTMATPGLKTVVAFVNGQSWSPRAGVAASVAR